MLKALGRDVVIYGAGEFLFKFIAFAVFPIYAYELTVAQFGIWALLQVTALLLGYVANLGISQAVQRFYFDRTVEGATGSHTVSTGLLALSASLCLIVGAVLVATIPFGDALQTRFGIEWPLLLLALVAVIPDQIVQYCMDVLRIHFTPLKFLVLSFAKNVAGTGAALYLLLEHDAGLYGIFLGLLSGSLIAVPVGLWMIRRDLRWHYNPILARGLLAFGGPLVFTSVAHWMYTSLDRWMLAEMTTTEEVGLYSVAAKVATILVFMISAFGQAWMPFALRMSRDDPDHAAFFGRILSLWSFFLAVAALAIGLYAREVLMLLTPAVYWDAAPILPLLAAGLAFFGTTLVTGLGISLSKRTIYSTIGTWLAGVANFGLNLILIPSFGAIGSAAATLLSYILLTAFLFAKSQRLHPIPLHRGQLLYCALLTGCAAGLAGADFAALSITAALIKFGILLMAVVGAFAIGILDRSILQIIRLKRAA